MGVTHLSGLKLFDIKYTVGAESSNAIDVAIQLRDSYDYSDLKERKTLPFYLASDENGEIPATVAPTGGIAVQGPDGAMIESVANLSGMILTSSNGNVTVRLTDTGTPTFYLVIVLPDGSRAVSPAITFA